MCSENRSRETVAWIQSRSSLPAAEPISLGGLRYLAPQSISLEAITAIIFRIAYPVCPAHTMSCFVQNKGSCFPLFQAHAHFATHPPAHTLPFPVTGMFWINKGERKWKPLCSNAPVKERATTGAGMPDIQIIVNLLIICHFVIRKQTIFYHCLK